MPDLELTARAAASEICWEMLPLGLAIALVVVLLLPRFITEMTDAIDYAVWAWRSWRWPQRQDDAVRRSHMP